tara:strand:- start:337 stop:618 length:282 start_codon:yes stop_codon:yes gene_type:complete
VLSILAPDKYRGYSKDAVMDTSALIGEIASFRTKKISSMFVDGESGIGVIGSVKGAEVGLSGGRGLEDELSFVSNERRISSLLSSVEECVSPV